MYLIYLSFLGSGFAVQGQVYLEDKGLNCYWFFLLVSLIGSALSRRDYDTQGIILHIIFLIPHQNGRRIVESVLFSVPSEGRSTIFEGNHKSSACSKRNEGVGWSFWLIFFKILQQSLDYRLMNFWIYFSKKRINCFELDLLYVVFLKKYILTVDLRITLESATGADIYSSKP